MAYILEEAYGVRLYQISGPEWATTYNDSHTYLISATFHTPASQDEVRSMLRSLLAERLHLAAHWETREQPTYRLIADRKGSRLKKGRAGRLYTSSLSDRRLAATQISMPQLVELLSMAVGRPVVDETQLAGTFDIQLNWIPDSASATPTEQGPSIFDAIREIAGLRLVAQKSGVKTLVIDHIEKTPTEN